MLSDHHEVKDYYFTFGFGQAHENCYVIIRGEYSDARREMIRRYGRNWSMQYSSAEAAGVKEYNLTKLEH